LGSRSGRLVVKGGGLVRKSWTGVVDCEGDACDMIDKSGAQVVHNQV